MEAYVGGRRLCGIEIESIEDKFYLERMVWKDKSRRGFFNVKDLNVGFLSK